MLTKCAAPSCSAPFRRLNEGRLFRLELDLSCALSPEEEGSAKEEYYWLCADCSQSLRLYLDARGRVVVVPHLHLTLSGEHQPEVATISRQAGRLLRSVSVYVAKNDPHLD